MDDLGLQIEANLAQVGANHDVIGANLGLVKSAGWRVIRNRRLLDRCHRLVRANDLLLAENSRLLARRQRLIDAHRA